VQDKEKSDVSLKTFTASLEIGHPIGHQNLTLVPLIGPSSLLDYILAAEAIQKGMLTVREVDQSGNVNVLIIENHSDKRILLLDGEELIGAKQNRILNTTVFLEINITQKIPVSCVESGRWRHVSEKFTSGIYAPPMMRNHKSQVVSRNLEECGLPVSNQGQVWDDVENYVQHSKAASSTRAMRDAIDHQSVSLNSFVQALPYPQGTRGVMASVSGHFAAMDVLDQPKTLEQIWNRLVTGFAMDAVRQSRKEHTPFTASSAKFILDSIPECAVKVFPSVGLGHELRFESSHLQGQALEFEGQVVHMSVFPNEEQRRSGEPEGSHIMPPSFRRRPRRDGGHE